jgi:hypothetical protein
MNFPSGTAVLSLTSQGASFIFDFYLAISVLPMLPASAGATAAKVLVCFLY